MTIEHQIRLLQGYTPYQEPADEPRYPIWLGIGVPALSVWALVIAAGYWLVG